MEEYLENMKSLRSYMNDLEEDAAKRSADEQKQRTTIDAHDADIALVRAQAKQASEETEQLTKARAQVCVEMAEKQGRIAALEVECATMKQTLELLYQEIGSTSAKLEEKRLFYTKTTENMTAKLQEQQEWLGSFKIKMTRREPHAAASQSKPSLTEGMHSTENREERHGMYNAEGRMDKLEGGVGNKQGELNTQLESAQLKIESIKSERSVLLLETSKIKQILEQEKNIIAGFPAALPQMDIKSLEEEFKALQGDNAQEVEYLQTLEETINEMKSVSAPVKCCCGLEYKVELGGEAMDMS